MGSSPTSGTIKKYTKQQLLAYLIGLAIGDGNLSNPNGRATRLRITCDLKYPRIIKNIEYTIKKLFPQNKVSIINRKDSCVDISVYSNRLEKLLGWEAKNGSKIKQSVSVPLWIKSNLKYAKPCLRGLIETDGSVYRDRNYLMINFVTTIPRLAKDFSELTNKLGYSCNLQVNKPKTGLAKYTVRISHNVKEFIKLTNIDKS